MKLPAADRAIVDIAKLRDYCLNAYHPRGRHKARLFNSALGLTAHDAPILRAELLRAAREGEVVAGRVDEFGARYSIDFVLAHRDRLAIVRSSWIVGETELPG